MPTVGVAYLLPKRSQVATVVGVEEIELLWQMNRRVGPHVLRLTVGLVDDRAEVVGFELWAVDPVRVREQWGTRLPLVPDGAPIQATDLRVPIRKLLAQKRAGQRETARVLVTHPNASQAMKDEAAHLLEVLPDENDAGRGRRSYGRSFYASVAEVYLAAQREGRPPTSAVAEHGKVNKSTAGKWVSRAREFGFLAPTSRGKTSSAPTPRRPK